MANPLDTDWNRLKRLARYLQSRTRCVTEYPYAEREQVINVWVDADFAGCKRTRRSTSGGAVMWGEAIAKAWSTTQGIIALSSGKAEYYGIVNGTAMALGLRNLVSDLGIQVGIIVITDASAAKGIASRRGAGRARHIEVCQLWLQQTVLDGEIQVRKVPGSQNLADAFTKGVGSGGLEKHMSGTRQFII